ncbi:hypothetical protein PHYBOEH_003537 [Phytophthora boehmeriae]|uniref:RxLR effector protein n=1 Tax=Phytophthora boehmeriae TaxID=109152 RepID=A0A8T1XDC4_9STRA|nr:hypothetical protein PHYBOEH_003537 [Phytophthora boehmeriae]
MRMFSALLIVTTTLCVSSDAALPAMNLKLPSSNSLLSNQPISAEKGTPAGRYLRVPEDDDTLTMASDAEEERGVIPKASELMKKLDLDNMMEATIVRSIMKGHPAEKTLGKMGVSPSFVTAEGQKVYSKYDEGYRTYRSWYKWVEDNANWLVKDLKG